MATARISRPADAAHTRANPERFYERTSSSDDDELGSTPPGDHSPSPKEMRLAHDLFQQPEDNDDEPVIDDFRALIYDHVPAQDTLKEARKLIRNHLVNFEGRILFIGCGAVAQCVLPLLPRLVKMPMSNVTVIDAFDTRDRIKDSIKLGVKFAIENVTKANLTGILAKYLRSGDMLVDLAYEIPSLMFMEWCRDHNVSYINAALEVDSPYKDARTTDVRQFTLYHRHQELEKRLAEWENNDGPTAVIEHGANPGLVSHFVKLGLVHIAQKVIAEKPLEDPARTERLKVFMAAKDWPHLAMELGVKTIHVSERDTQVTDKPKQVGEFVNTWSPLGFYQEGIAPAELGWGTHERELPPQGASHMTGNGAAICLKTKGINTLVRSYVPQPHGEGDTIAMVVRHGEAYTIPQFLSVHNEKGECIYRPTCHYAYLPCDAAMNSLHEMRMRGYKAQAKTRVLKDEIVSGQDVLGCLLMGHDFGAWWIGSMLDIHESRELVPHQSATIVQVGIGFAAALQWILANPGRGVCVPDELPYEEILRESLPYLGPFVSMPVDWSPLKAAAREEAMEYRTELTGRLEQAQNDPDLAWQFTSFLVQ